MAKINVDSAAKGMASAFTEADMSFDMSVWHAKKEMCGTKACLAGHIFIANGGKVNKVNNKWRPEGFSTWTKAALDTLFNEKGKGYSRMMDLFINASLSKYEALERFESLLLDNMTKEQKKEYYNLLEVYCESLQDNG